MRSLNRFHLNGLRALEAAGRMGSLRAPADRPRLDDCGAGLCLAGKAIREAIRFPDRCVRRRGFVGVAAITAD